MTLPLLLDGRKPDKQQNLLLTEKQILSSVIIFTAFARLVISVFFKLNVDYLSFSIILSTGKMPIAYFSFLS